MLAPALYKLSMVDWE